MSITLVVLIVAVVCAVGAYVVSIKGAKVDPIDPTAEINWLVRRLRRRPRLVRFLRARMDRTTASGFALTVVFGVVFLSALGVGSLFDMVTRNAGFARFDKGVANWGATNVTSQGIRVLRIVTDFGSTAVIVLVAVVVGALVSWRRRRPGPALFMLAVVGGQFLLSNGLKLAVGRARPDVGRFVSVSGSSFPSGHATAAAATWAAVALALTRGRSRRSMALSGGAAALIAAAVGASRALLGAHWLTDVLAGLVLGWGWFVLVAVTFGGRALRAALPVERIAGRALATTPGASAPVGMTAAGADADASARPATHGRAPDDEQRRRHRAGWRIGGRLAAIWLVLVAIGSAIGLLIVHVIDHGSVGHADEHVNVWVVTDRTPTLDRVTSWLSNLGSTPVVVGLALLAVVALRIISRRWRLSLVLAAGLLLEVTSFVAIANLVGRARPDVVRLDPSPPTSSYPSGHTAASVALYVGLALLVIASIRRPIGRWLVAGAAGLIPAAVGASRVYRGMHHPSDVLTGALLGALCIYASHKTIGVGDPEQHNRLDIDESRHMTAAHTAHTLEASDQRVVAGSVLLADERS